ncbi:MAG TPA: cbb3-type cytochrome oxidase assembly protein CcoS [Anaeromyxobacteraceae bacterium]|nr:cbb3-type cytochrome oxidase assembly protein CcoS [Anaeromyxobacteraceae bacterium]
MDLGFLIALSLALGVAAWLFFLWSVRSGQYDDPEGPKYRMLEDDPDERKPPPAPPTRRAPPAAKGEHDS